MVRSKNADTMGNGSYNPINGSDRRQADIPDHTRYNPPGSSGSNLGKAGAMQMFGGDPDLAGGRPARGMDRQFQRKNFPNPHASTNPNLGLGPPTKN